MPRTTHYPLSTSCPEARLYHSTASVWLSVDPLSDKYPGVSPYVYCANNPVRLVDPDGREIWIDGYRYVPGGVCPDGVGEHTFKKWNSLNSIYEKRNGAIVIDEMSSSDFQFCISSETNSKGAGCYERDGNESGTIYLNGGNDNIGTLSHELFHGYQHLKGQEPHSIFNEIEAYLYSFSITNDFHSLLYYTQEDCSGDNEVGVPYNKCVTNLLYGSDFSQEDFDYTHTWFCVCAKANFRGTYNSYSTSYPQKSLIKDFYPLVPQPTIITPAK